MESKPCKVAILVFLTASMPRVALAADCPELQILDAAAANEAVHEDYEGSAMDAQWYQRRVVRDAEKLMPKLLCSAARRVAFVHQDLNANRGLAGRTDQNRPDLLQMSAAPGAGLASEDELDPESRQESGDRADVGARREDKAAIARVLTMQAILHEAAHSADYLLQRYGSGSLNPIEEAVMDEGYWNEASERLAEDVVKKNRLAKGLREEWWRIQVAFGEAGYAANYHGQGKHSGWSDDEIVKGGFMSSYGGDKLSDDIAEMTAWALAGEAMRNSMVDPQDELPTGPIKDLACDKLRELPGPGVKIEFAAVYTKLGLLQTTGFISDEAYRRCVGNVKVRGSGNGFFSHKSGRLTRSYTGDVQSRIGKRVDRDGTTDESSRYVFELTAKGTVSITNDGEVPVLATLRLAVADKDADLEDASYPRGLYTVGVAAPDNQFIIVRTDTDKVVMEVTQGLALVARASESLIEGSLVVQKYFNFSGGMLSAIGGPQPPREPTLISFRIRK